MKRDFFLNYHFIQFKIQITELWNVKLYQLILKVFSRQRNIFFKCSPKAPLQNKKDQKKISRCTVFCVFFSAASCKKRHRKLCTWKMFWPFLFCDDFSTFFKLFFFSLIVLWKMQWINQMLPSLPLCLKKAIISVP